MENEQIYYMDYPPLIEHMTLDEEPLECYCTSVQPYLRSDLDKCTIQQLSYQPNYDVKRTMPIRPTNNLKLSHRCNDGCCSNGLHKPKRRMENCTVYQLSYQPNRGVARTMPIYPKKNIRLTHKCGNSCCMPIEHFSISTVPFPRKCIRIFTQKQMLFQPNCWYQYPIPNCPPKNVSYGASRTLRC